MPRQQYVVEHGSLGRFGGDRITRWEDSSQPFTPRLIQGRDPKYATWARPTCTVCGARFSYKGLRPRLATYVSGFGILLTVVAYAILANLNAGAAMVAVLLEAILVLVFLMSVFKPRKPYFRQTGGTTRYSHRVRRYP